MKIIAFLLVTIVALTTAEWNELMEAGYFEGDMDLTPSQILLRKSKNSFGSTTHAKWPKVNGLVTIMYTITAGVHGATNAINDAIADYEASTCLRFQENNTMSIRNAPHIRFVTGGGCSSPVGRKLSKMNWLQYEGNQVKLHDGPLGTCWTKGIVIHEMMHSIGFQHEQSRPDRDQFVTINYGSITPDPVTGRDRSFNFNKANNVNSLGHAYDYNSVMHYGSTAFGEGNVTITTTDAAFQNVIGQRGGFSLDDIAQINTLYGCP